MRSMSQLRDLRRRHLGKLRVLNSRPNYLRSDVYHQFHEEQSTDRSGRLLLRMHQHNSCIGDYMIQRFL
jgi:hypothetical protein